MQENYLAKWLNNELTETELSEFKKSDDYASYIKVLEASKKLEAPNFDVATAYERFKDNQELQDTKVVPLRPFKSFLRVAAAIAILLTGSYFLCEFARRILTAHSLPKEQKSNYQIILKYY